MDANGAVGASGANKSKISPDISSDGAGASDGAGDIDTDDGANDGAAAATGAGAVGAGAASDDADDCELLTFDCADGADASVLFA